MEGGEPRVKTLRTLPAASETGLSCRGDAARMTTTHIVNLILAVGIVAGLTAVCRIAFLVAGDRPASGERQVDERLAA